MVTPVGGATGVPQAKVGATGATGVPAAVKPAPMGPGVVQRPVVGGLPEGKVIGEPGRVLDPQPPTRAGEGKVLDPSGPLPEQGADNADTGAIVGRAPPSAQLPAKPPVGEEKRGLQPPVGKSGNLKELDADDFWAALMVVVQPLPSIKQGEVDKILDAFMDVTMRGAPMSFREALRAKYA